MVLKDQRTKRQLVFGGLAAILIAIVVSLALAFLFDRIGAPAESVSVGTGIETMSTNFRWTTTVVLIEGLKLIAMIAGIWFLATSRTYLGAGVTRREILANHAKIGAVGVVILMVVAALFWSLSFIGDGPVLSGVTAASVALIPLSIIGMYFWGTLIVAVFLRFRTAPVLAVILVLFGVTVAADSVNSGALQGLNIYIVPSGLFQIGSISEIAGEYIWLAVLILGGGAITYAAMTTLPMRRS